MKKAGKAERNEIEAEIHLTAIIEAKMVQIFGITATKFLFDYLESEHQLMKEDIPMKPEIFSRGLEEILESGAKMLEKNILKGLYLKLGLNYVEKEKYKFADYIKEAKALSKFLLRAKV